MLISLRDANLDKFKSILMSLFESIAHDNFRNNDIAHFEGFYASVVYSYLAGSGLDIIAEDVTKRGNIDLTIIIQENIYVVEFKVTNKKPKTNIALQQIKDRKYHLKYMNKDKNVYILGIVFNEDDKNIDEFRWERVK
jgi:Holliday junction resolvase-like predicted endonuclease